MKKDSFNLYIDKTALIKNLEYIINKKKKLIIPVIKANAYGHGYENILNILYDYGLRIFAVARYNEALNIMNNKNYEQIKIIVLESIDDYEYINNSSNIVISINSIDELHKAILNKVSTEKMTIKIDLGFSRNGISIDELELLRDIILKNNFNFFGIHSHLFSTSYKDGLKQINIFKRFIDNVGKDRFKTIHLQNTAATFNYDVEISTHLRIGMMLYGLQEPGFFDENLNQVFSLEGEISTIKNIDKSEYIAYCKKDEIIKNKECNKIAMIKIGYGDGFLKVNENTFCLINNKEYKIVQITMDASFIEIDDRVKVGDLCSLYYDQRGLKNNTGFYIHELLPIISNLRISRIAKKGV